MRGCARGCSIRERASLATGRCPWCFRHRSRGCRRLLEATGSAQGLDLCRPWVLRRHLEGVEVGLGLIHPADPQKGQRGEKGDFSGIGPTIAQRSELEEGRQLLLLAKQVQGKQRARASVERISREELGEDSPQFVERGPLDESLLELTLQTAGPAVMSPKPQKQPEQQAQARREGAPSPGEQACRGEPCAQRNWG